MAKNRLQKTGFLEVPLIINTTFAYKNETEAKRGGVSNQQLEDIESSINSGEKTDLSVAICHHHPILHEDHHLGADDVMENGSLLVTLLEKYGFHLLIHGHKHHPKLQYGPGGNSAFPIFASGSLSAILTNELAQFSQNTFHLVKLNGDGTGLIKTWKFRLSEGWTNASYEATGIPAVAGFGNKEPIDSLHIRIRDWFKNSNKSLILWSDVVASFPGVQYLVPSSFLDLGSRLAADGFDLIPKAPDIPNILGVLQK